MSQTPAEIIKGFDVDDVRSIDSIESALALLQSASVNAIDIADLLGDGFSLTEKRDLINKTFLIFDMKVVEGDHGSFAVVRCVTAEGKKAVFTDGGAGIHQQVQQLLSKNVIGGVLCNNGLNVSEYEYTDEKGKSTPAKTYYLAL